MASGFDVSALSNYTDQTSKDLLTAAQFKAETGALATPYPGVRSAATLQLLATDAIPQDGAACGFNASGSATFTQRTLTTAAIAIQDNLCPRTLETKWTQLLLKAGQNYTENDIPKMIMDNLVEMINKRLEVADWQGDTTSGSAYLQRYDGLIKIINAASGVVTATASTFNATNAIAIMNNMVLNIPAALKGDPSFTFCMGYDAAEVYRQAVITANLFHYNPGSQADDLYVVGSIYKIKPLHGLDGLYVTAGQSCVFGFRWSNVFLGVDMMNEEETAKLWYSMDFDLVKYSFRFRRGWQVAYPSEIVKYANS